MEDKTGPKAQPHFALKTLSNRRQCARSAQYNLEDQPHITHRFHIVGAAAPLLLLAEISRVPQRTQGASKALGNRDNCAVSAARGPPTEPSLGNSGGPRLQLRTFPRLWPVKTPLLLAAASSSLSSSPLSALPHASASKPSLTPPRHYLHH